MNASQILVHQLTLNLIWSAWLFDMGKFDLSQLVVATDDLCLRINLETKPANDWDWGFDVQ